MSSAEGSSNQITGTGIETAITVRAVGETGCSPSFIQQFDPASLVRSVLLGWDASGPAEAKSLQVHQVE